MTPGFGDKARNPSRGNMDSTELRKEAVSQPASQAFDVFLSYSRKDKNFAIRLENALESYRFPRSLKSVKRNLNVFRDESDIVASDDYHRTIKQELVGSAKLVVVCSPDARKSKYVDDEIRRFIENHGEQDIIPVLVRGKANNETTDENEKAFPEVLCENRMPLAANFLGWDTHKGKLDKDPFRSSFYQVLAAIHGIDRRKLEQIDEKVRARRRVLTLSIATAIIMILSVALVFAVIAAKAEKKAKDEAVVAKNDAIAQKGIAVKAQRKLQLQLLRAIAANTIKDVLSIESLPSEIFVTDPDDWVTLMKKNDQVFLTAREYNSGRVLAAGHDGVLTKADQEGKFLQPAFEWLTANGDPSILFSTGHCEVYPKYPDQYPDPGNFSRLSEQLKNWKYAVQTVPGVIDDEKLKGGGVLVIGNAWGNLTKPEIEAIEKFVSNGGGLFVVGLGWSWNQLSTTDPYFKCKEQEQTQGQNVNDMSTYPMNRVAEPYKMRWTAKDIPRDGQ